MMHSWVVFTVPAKGAVGPWMPCTGYGACSAALLSSEVEPDYCGKSAWAAPSRYQVHPGDCQLIHRASNPGVSCWEFRVGALPSLVLVLQCGATGRGEA